MKKFWNQIVIKKSFDTFQILLDKTILKTPQKKDLNITNFKIAQEVSREWDQDTNQICTKKLIFYNHISTAIDRVYNDRKLFISEILNFIDTDLICYRAESPKDLVELQNIKWDPISLMIEKYIGVKLDIFSGIMPRNQDYKVHNKIDNLIDQFSNLEISVLHKITCLTGSVFLSICILKNDISKKDAFEISFLDEIWQEKNWGYEEESSLKRDKIFYELKKSIDLLVCLRQ